MTEQNTITVTLATNLISRAGEVARDQNRSLSDLLAVATERYLLALRNQETLLRLGLEHGRHLGITSDEDVERMAEEWRAEQRAAH